MPPESPVALFPFRFLTDSFNVVFIGDSTVCGQTEEMASLKTLVPNRVSWGWTHG